jgi:hypothetical protein
LGSTGHAVGQPGDHDKWQFLLEPYGFIPKVPVTAANGEEVEISQSQVIENLSGALMLIAGARKDKWTFYLDTIYFDLEGEDSATRQTIGLPGAGATEFDVDIEIDGWLITGSATYAVIDSDSTRLEVGGGVRYYQEDIDFELDIGPIKATADYSWELWDGVAMVRGFTDLNDKWYLSYYADASTGGTDLTYQVAGVLNYRFDDYTLAGGYRYIKWEFDKSSDAPGSIAKDQVAEGPFIGLKFFFD